MQNSGFSNLLRFLFVMAVASVAWYYLYPKPAPKPEEPESPKLPAVTREQAAAVASPAILAGKPFSDLLPGRAPKPVEPPKPAVVVPTEPPAYVALGDDSFALKVLLTSKGAGVQQLILTKFKEANRQGRTVVDTATQKPQPLCLIPGLVATKFLYLADESEVHELSANLSAADFAAGKKPGPGPTSDRLSAPSYTLLHYPAKDDPLRPLDKDNKLRPDDDRIPLATLGEQPWKIVSVKQPADGPWEVVFESDALKDAPYFLKLRKTFSLDRKDYDFKLKVDILPQPGRLKGAGKFRYQIAGAVGMPIEGEWYTQSFRTAYVGWVDGTGTPRRELDDASNVHYRHGGEPVVNPGRFTYAAVGTQYFASALAVDGDVSAADQPWEYVRPTRELPRDTPEAPEKPRQTYEQEKYFLFDMTVRAVSKVFDPAEPITHTYAVYNGPIKVRLLSQLTGDAAVPPEDVERYTAAYHLDTMTDYHSPTWFGRRLDGIGWTSLIIFTTNLMHRLLGGLHGLTDSWGLAIILVTVCVRLCLFFPSRRQQTINAHMSAKIAALKPELDKLQEKYKDDFLAHAQAKRQLMARAGINQMSQMGGCVLLLLQMPILMGLYFCLQESVFFRLEKFLWVPNLAAPDMTSWWTESVPMISTPWSRFGSFSFLYLGPYFNALPLAAVVLFYVQQRLTMPPPTDDIQAQQQAIMKYMLIFTALFFFKVAAGLCVYFIVGGLWALLERRLVPKPDVTKAQAAVAGVSAEKLSTPPPERTEKKAEQPTGFWGRIKSAMEEAQRQAQSQRQIRNDNPGGTGGQAAALPPRQSAADRAQQRKNKKKRK